MSQVQAADSFSVSVWTWRQWELGIGDVPTPATGKLHSYEACFVMRRRYGMSRTEIASVVGVSCYWITQMERGAANPKRLVRYWS